jgi:Protein of unknown function DUF262
MEQIIDKIIFERKSLKWLYDQQNSGHLTVDNTFQRRYVWVHKNQVQLIESIICGYPIPEIYLWERETDPVSGTTKHSIIDGQQRLGAIFDFLNDKFILQLSSIENKDADYKNKAFKDLTDDQKSKLWKYPLAVRFVKESVLRENIVEMFLRLNKTNTTLNPQELRNAEFEGLFLRLSQVIADNSFWSDNKIFYQNDIRRMLDIQFASSILVFFRFGFDEEITQASINRAYDTFNESYADYEKDKTLFENLIKSASELIEKYPSSLKLFQRKVHLYTLFTTLYFYHLKYSKFDDKHLENYGFFATNYDKIEELTKYFGTDKVHLIEEYKSLALEGTGQRINRQKRFEIIRSFTE